MFFRKQSKLNRLEDKNCDLKVEIAFLKGKIIDYEDRIKCYNAIKNIVLVEQEKTMILQPEDECQCGRCDDCIGRILAIAKKDHYAFLSTISK